MRILCLSDIHYKVKFEEDPFKESVDLFFDSFKKRLTSIVKEKPIDLLLLSGDLAFSGNTKEYELLLQRVKSCVRKDLPILSIPGNHDVDFKELKIALSGRPLDQLYKIEESEIVENKNDVFSNVFLNYYNEFQKKANEETELSTRYKFDDKLYCGYYFDPTDKVIIVLLNSSWYSFGAPIVKDFFEEECKGIDDPLVIIEKAKKYIKGSLAQQGEQSYFVNSFPYYNEIKEMLDEDDTIRVISFAHHPIDWLKWDEQFKKSNDNNKRLDYLVDLSSLLVTGHIHNPVIPPSIYNSRCYHLNNGAFMEYKHITNEANVELQAKFPNNWFTILDVDNDSFNYQAFQFEAHGEVCDWKIKNELRNQYYYFGNLREKSQGAVHYLSHKPPESTLEYRLPNNIDHFRKILLSSRENIIETQLDLKTKIEVSMFYDCEINEEVNLVTFNTMDELYDLMLGTDKSNFDKLVENEQFSTIIAYLNADKRPIIAFFDIVSFSERVNIKAFEKEYNSQFVKFQSFKHLFFTKFEELYNFKETEIVYDMLIVS